MHFLCHLLAEPRDQVRDGDGELQLPLLREALPDDREGEDPELVGDAVVAVGDLGERIEEVVGGQGCRGAQEREVPGDKRLRPRVDGL